MGLVSTAGAGVHLVETDHNLMDDSRARTSIWLDNGRLRVEDSAENLVFHYKADESFFLIHDATRSLVSRITIEELRQLTAEVMGQATDAMPEGMSSELNAQIEAMIEEARATLSPEELAELEALGIPNGDTPEAEPSVWTLVATGQPVQEWNCHQYRLGTAEWVEEEVWTTSASSMGLEAADVRAFTSLIDLMSELAGVAEPYYELGDPSAQGHFTGYPVKRIQYSGGQPVLESETRIVERGPLDPALFQVPAGCRDVPFMELMMGQGFEE